MKPNALVLLATGTNRDQDVSEALRLAGALPEIVPLNELRADSKRFQQYQMLVVPGGFSYADALGAGKLLALDLQAYFADEVNAFVESGKPVIGICNGFQALVKAGILPGSTRRSAVPEATLTFNERSQFECRWVNLSPVSKRCIWTRNLTEMVFCPVAHGEGNFVTAEFSAIDRLKRDDQVAFIYADPAGGAARGVYPLNPNGSQDDIAGICNPQGNVLGLMPHPENHIYLYQHPRWTRGERSGSGLALFASGVRYAMEV